MTEITAPRFVGLRTFKLCLDGARMTEQGFDADGDLTVDEPNDPRAVAAIQQALSELGYDIQPTGLYGPATSKIVKRFKIDQRLAVPAGIVAHDGVVGRGTSRRLNELFTPAAPVDDPELHYTDRKSYYTNLALSNANGFAHADWSPEDGYQVNRARIVDVYGYYRDLADTRPEEFLWAGLGHMAGGAIVSGLDFGIIGATEETIMVRIGRDIFFDLAWQHETFMDRPDTIVELAGLHDQFAVYPTYDGLGQASYAHRAPARSYRAAWEKIFSGDPVQVAEGNRDLLQNEQFSIVQPQYDFLRKLTGLITPFTNEIHPYHRAFIVENPLGDILAADDRWSWITAGMWTNWVAAGTGERTRLVDLPFDQICRHDFGIPGRPDLLPPGGP